MAVGVIAKRYLQFVLACKAHSIPANSYYTLAFQAMIGYPFWATYVAMFYHAAVWLPASIDCGCLLDGSVADPGRGGGKGALAL